MAAKKSAVDRVIAELEIERGQIDKTIARLKAAQQSAAAKKATRKRDTAAAPTQERA